MPDSTSHPLRKWSGCPPRAAGVKLDNIHRAVLRALGQCRRLALKKGAPPVSAPSPASALRVLESLLVTSLSASAAAAQAFHAHRLVPRRWRQNRARIRRRKPQRRAGR